MTCCNQIGICSRPPSVRALLRAEGMARDLQPERLPVSLCSHGHQLGEGSSGYPQPPICPRLPTLTRTKTPERCGLTAFQKGQEGPPFWGGARIESA